MSPNIINNLTFNKGPDIGGVADNPNVVWTFATYLNGFVIFVIIKAFELGIQL